MATKNNSRKRRGVTASVTRTPKMRISRRIINGQQHTKGYVVNGVDRTVNEVTRMALAGQIAGVRVVGNHIQAAENCRRLSDLPTKRDVPAKRTSR